MKLSHRSTGFTLIELLVVVVILGILAAIVLPQFSSASADSKANTLKAQLRQIRGQIELYKAQHGSIPNLAPNWSALTGVTTSTLDGANYGPYLLFEPVNPMNHSSVVVDGTPASPGGTGGYVYDYTGGTGSIYAFDGDSTTVLSY
jgi:general secretion pathway protein G